ncbi:glycosyltransferase family 39 protein [Spirillospora sp. NPDC048911]|uniref:glycosyltransferase family 39 protein n=1 Tax=Spirillospora sp. NPDC048911 TaxID=3364527 RepID=UPI003722875D
MPRSWLVPILPMVIAVLVTSWRLDGPAFWRDETVTIGVAERSPAEIVRLMGHIDAVHGLYYLLMHPVVTLFGPGEIAMRAPSVMAAAVAAGMTALLGARLADARVGLVAGVLVAVSPAISRYAQEARQYALATALAVVSTYLLVRAAEKGDRRWFAGYAVSVAVLGWLQVFYLLLLPAHAVMVTTAHERVRLLLRRWAVAVASALLAVVPLLLEALPQRKLQVEWIPAPDQKAIEFLLEMLSGSSWSIVPVLALVLLALVRPVRRAGPVDPRWAGAAWLFLPPAILLGTSVLVPNYVFRYVLFCVPAVALMIGLALRRLPAWIAGIAVIAIAGATIPTQLKVREPDSRADDMRQLSVFLKQNERPGDAIVFSHLVFRRVMNAYPDAYEELNDIALARPGARTGTIDGQEVPPAELARRLTGVQRVWYVWKGSASGPSTEPTDQAKVTLILRDRKAFKRVARYRFKGGTLTLYERRPDAR